MNEVLAKRLLGACALVGVTLILANLLPEPQALPPPEPAAKRLTYDLRPAPLEIPAEPVAAPPIAPMVVAEAPPPVVPEPKQETAAPAPPEPQVAPPKPKPKPKAKPQPVQPPPAEVALAAAPEPAVVAKAEAPESKPEAPAAAQNWFVQIGAFAKEANAQQSVARLQKAGLNARQDKLEWKSGTRYRVRCGPFASREEAEAERLRAAQLGFGDARVAHEPAG